MSDRTVKAALSRVADARREASGVDVMTYAGAEADAAVLADEVERLRGAEPSPKPETEAVMRARAVLHMEIMRLREKAAAWRADNAGAADRMEADADELETVRQFLVPLDYPSAAWEYDR